MTDAREFEMFLAAPPGLEPVLLEEARALGFDGLVAEPGGVVARGDWPELWRANLMLRGASRVLARLASFPALHLAQLDKRAGRLPWGELLRPDVPVRVVAECRRSRIWHEGAAAERVARAIAEAAGAPATAGAARAGAEADADAETDEGAPLRVLARIERDLCTLSLDSSGAALHRRGAKLAVGKAPLRETLAALFLRACGHAPGEPVLDPMCGSGTFAIEAAEMAAGLAPGRLRSFAFERVAGFDAARWAAMRAAAGAAAVPPEAPRAFGFDRDEGAVAASRANAERAGVAAWTRFERGAVSAFAPPEGLSPGLVMVNPPYGERIGDKGALGALYAALGAALRARFAGWRVGLVTSEAALARATGLPFGPPGPPVPHGPLRIRLWQARIG